MFRNSHEKDSEKGRKKAKCKGETPTKRVKDVMTELYPIDETIDKTTQEGPDVLAKYVTISQPHTFYFQTVIKQLFCRGLYFFICSQQGNTSPTLSQR